MNRKQASKLAIKVESAKKLHFDVPYDDVMNWLTDPPPCPWTDEEIADYQLKLDSAFGVEKGIVLAWSADRRFWDEVYMDSWDIYGEPTSAPQKTPLLLFKQININDKDRIYISAPRWMLLESIHGSQLETSWKADVYEADDSYIGGRKRVRRPTPPECIYQPLLPPLGTLATHEYSSIIGAMKPCCQRLWDADKTICYGKYRPPTADDLIAVKRIRERMDADGLYQRNDAQRSQKLISRASDATQYHMDYAARKRKEAVRELLLTDPKQFMGAVFKNYGMTLNATEIDRTLKAGFKRKDEQEKI